MPPQGLLHLAAVAIAAGYHASILDAQALGLTVSQTLESIIHVAPDYVGVSMFTSQVHVAMELVEGISARLPGCRVIVGGPHLSSAPVETFERYPSLRYGVVGEGEVTLLEILARFDRGETDLGGISGTIYRDPGTATVQQNPSRAAIHDLDSLPDPRWDLLPALDRFYRPSLATLRRLPATGLVSSRGCRHSCTFCDRSVFGSTWRGHSASRLVEWMSHLYRTWGIVGFHFADDNFVADAGRLEAFCDELLASGLSVDWSANARPTDLPLGLLDRMSRSGCWQLAFGIESGNDRILRLLQKGQTRRVIEGAVHATHDAGILVKGYFMAGLPTETLETLEETLEFARTLNLDYASMSAFTPMPGTEIYRNFQEYGEMVDDWSVMNRWDPVFIPHGLSRDDLASAMRRCSFYREGKHRRVVPAMLPDKESGGNR